MQSIINYYRLLNILSLDVAFGAAVSTLFLTQMFDVVVTFQGLLCLFLTVWLIYTADHLVDARLIKTLASTLRHQFHQRYFNIILLIAVIVLSIIILLLFFIQKPVFYWGLGLAVLVILYFFVQRSFGFLKEILGALLYCTGVMLPVVALSEMSIYSLLTFPSILFFNTALINLILFSWFGRENDLVDKHSSIATALGKRATGWLLYLLLLVQLGSIGYAFTMNVSYSSLLVFALMFLGLLFIYLNAEWFAIEDKYRLAGDAVFLIPLIHWIL